MTEVQRAFVEDLHNKMHSRLLSYATVWLKNAALADDAVQEVFMRVCENIDALMKHESPDGWVFLTFKNVLSDVSKDRVRDIKLLERAQYRYILNHGNEPAHNDESHPDFLYSNLIENEDYRLMRTLSDGGLSMAELAEREGISVEACKKRVQRARRALQKFFEKS